MCALYIVISDKESLFTCIVKLYSVGQFSSAGLRGWQCPTKTSSVRAKAEGQKSDFSVKFSTL